MAANGQGPTPITGINVTPLVDVTLVLLVVFMVTAKLIVNNHALPVELPKAATAGEVQEIFSVTLAANGATEVNGLPLASDDALLPHATRARAQRADVRAVIRADGAVPHRRVMHVLDVLRQASIAKVGFSVTPAASASNGTPSPP